jgi:hypothetical protein
MTSIFLKANTIFFAGVLTLLLLPFSLFAQDSLSLSVSPTIFDMTANPGQTWRSTVRIINANPYELTVYVDVAGFVPKGEEGVPRFIPLDQNQSEDTSLGRWISAEKSITIPAEKTVEFPFTITLPADAAPGGHFAALMISTKPNDVGDDTSVVQTSQVITSLIFLRVSGDITENSSVRSFRTTNYFLSKPEATFELRIENRGNVHVQPQGEISIYNMWGQERGTIPVNQQTLFGNVLPNSVRKYSFTWTGEWSPTDIGRYTAVATLGYGLDEKQFMHADTAFWIIPWKFLLLLFTVVGGFIAIMSWAIKLYIRRVLSLAGVQAPIQSVQTDSPAKPAERKSVTIPLTKGRRTKKQQFATVVAPIEIGILDLRSRLEHTKGLKTTLLTIYNFVKQYWKFFAPVLAIVFFIIALVWFVRGANTPERDFEVIIRGEGGDVKTSSNTAVPTEVESSPKATTTQNFTLSLVNRSGDIGLNDKVTALLEKSGYTVSSATQGDGAPEARTVIVYDPKEAEAVLRLSKILDNALLSSFTDTSASSTQVVIYLGEETLTKVE